MEAMTSLAPGFADPVRSSQAVFRAVMDAMARPGTTIPMPTDLAAPAPLSPAAAAVALALLDYESPVWLDPPLAAAPEVARWLRFHAGAPVTQDPRQASFALVSNPAELPAFDAFALGTDDYPDRSTTLILQVEEFSGPAVLQLSGPGIREFRTFAASPLPHDIAARLEANRALFPRGVDLVLVMQDAVAALPRSTRAIRRT